MRGKKIPLETLEKIKKLRSEGYSLPELSKEFSTPKTTIFRYISYLEECFFLRLIRNKSGVQ